MDSSFNFGILIKKNQTTHKRVPDQFTVAGGIKKRIQIDKKNRRSLRYSVFDSRRAITTESPKVVKEKKVTTKLEHRKMQLAKWKEEKEKKKKEEKLTKKKPFVCPMKYKPPPPPKPLPNRSGCVTRSQKNVTLNSTKTNFDKTLQQHKVASFAPKNAKFNPSLLIEEKPVLKNFNNMEAQDSRKTNEKKNKVSRPPKLYELRNTFVFQTIEKRVVTNKNNSRPVLTSDSSSSLEGSQSKINKSQQTDSYSENESSEEKLMSHKQLGISTVSEQFESEVPNIPKPEFSKTKSKKSISKNVVPKSDSTSRVGLRSSKQSNMMTSNQIVTEEQYTLPSTSNFSPGSSKTKRNVKSMSKNLVPKSDSKSKVELSSAKKSNIVMISEPIESEVQYTLPSKSNVTPEPKTKTKRNRKSMSKNVMPKSESNSEVELSPKESNTINFKQSESKVQHTLPSTSNLTIGPSKTKTKKGRKSMSKNLIPKSDSNSEVELSPKQSNIKMTPKQIKSEVQNISLIEKRRRSTSKNLSTPQNKSELKPEIHNQSNILMTPEQIEKHAQNISPRITLSRGKDNARREMKKKIEDGLLCELDEVEYFRQQLESEINRITELCNTWSKIQEQATLPDTAQEAILAAVGQGRLLMTQKLQQFASLLVRCEYPDPSQGLVTPEDLQGFWDMVYLQVINIDERFKKLEELRTRGWVEEKPVAKIKKTAKRAVKSSKPTATSRLGAMIAAARRAKKNDEETKDFEGGFFRVSSPVKPPVPSTPKNRTSLFKAVLSSEAKKASASKYASSSYAMLRASMNGKSVDTDYTDQDLIQFSPINLEATPGKSILKSDAKKKSKSMKVLFTPGPDSDKHESSNKENEITNESIHSIPRTPRRKSKLDIEILSPLDSVGVRTRRQTRKLNMEK